MCLLVPRLSLGKLSNKKKFSCRVSSDKWETEVVFVRQNFSCGIHLSTYISMYNSWTNGISKIQAAIFLPQYSRNLVQISIFQRNQNCQNLNKLFHFSEMADLILEISWQGLFRCWWNDPTQKNKNTKNVKIYFDLGCPILHNSFWQKRQIQFKQNNPVRKLIFNIDFRKHCKPSG